MQDSLNEQPSGEKESAAPEVEPGTWLDGLQVIADHLRGLVLLPLGVGVLSAVIAFSLPPTYTAKTQILLPQPQQQNALASMVGNLAGAGMLSGGGGLLKNQGEQYLAYMRTDALLDALDQRFNLRLRYDVQTKTDTRKALQGRTKLTLSKEGLIAIEVDDAEPEFAAKLANAYVEELQKLLTRLVVTEAQQRRHFFEKQLMQTKEQLAQAEMTLKSAGISDRVLKSNPSSAVAAVAALKAQVTAQEVKVGAMRGYYTESAPDFKLALSELANLRAQLAKQQREDAADPVQTGANAGAGDYVTRYRNYKYFETLYDIFAKQYELARVDEAREGAAIQVLDLAQAPERPSKPRKSLMTLMGIGLTALVLLAFVFARHSFRQRIQDPVFKEKLQRIGRSAARAWRWRA